MRSIPYKESLLVEFKSDKNKGYPDKDLVEAVVAMTNTEGGELYLGVEDNGEITGLVKKHEDEIGLSAMIMNSVVPSLFVQTKIIREEACTVMKISIPKSNVIVASSQGKILRRRLKSNGEPENIPMYPYEIATRLSDLSLLDFSFQTVHNATINDFDDNEIARLRNLIQRSHGDKTLLDLDDEELEKALCLVKEENGVLIPTITGLLLIGKEEKLKEYIPTAKSSFQVLDGTNIRVNEEFSKPILATLEIFEMNFNAWNPEVEIEDGLLRVSAPEFSKRAFREALVNAFCHRDYTRLGNVRVAIEDDGLTISNPGGFIEGITIENLLTAEPHGRNKTLSDALKRIGLVEKTGRGIDRIYEGSIIFGRPWPDYSGSTNSMIQLFIQRAKPDFEFSKMISDEINRLGKPLSINALLILSCINNEGRLNLRQIVGLTHISEPKAKATIERLIESNLIETIGQGKNPSYFFKGKRYKIPNTPFGFVREVEIDFAHCEELILDFVRDKENGISRKDVCDLLYVSKDQAYRLLKKLVDKNELKQIGIGNKTRYIKKSTESIH